METWQSNQISRPLTKVAEEIQKTNPKLVKNIVTKNISNRVQELNLNDQEKTKIVNNLIAKTDYLLSNNLNPLESVRSEINKTLALTHSTYQQDSNIKKSWIQKSIQKIKDFFINIFSSKNNKKNEPELNLSSDKVLKKNISPEVKIAAPSYTPPNKNTSLQKNDQKSR
ncbi:hypothetical protein H6P87_00138 [Rickettsia tillamookensis]|uniref:Uncharacterized protein n=1 Tax=Rickettsia tillamookensis TaxID=2761623 RepID=A0A9E6MGT6_9RICK|nr:hypothetical protein [Rickettsia tillamookensis]QQV74603.1 hypothetical protein H6P87_00138 [Rickettsia tillamookensis]